MNPNLILSSLASFILMLVASLHFFPPQNCMAQAITEPAKFNIAETNESLYPEQFRFKVNGTDYEVLPGGQGTQKLSGGTSISFRLPMGKNDVIEGIFYSPLSDGLIVIYQTRNDEVDGVAATVARLVSPNLFAKWRAHIPSFNVGPPLLAGSELYVTGFGFVGKLDITNGRYLWKHSRLYQPQSFRFESFGRPRIRGQIVEFPESISAPIRSPSVLKINRETGEIIE